MVRLLLYMVLTFFASFDIILPQGPETRCFAGFAEACSKESQKGCP